MSTARSFFLFMLAAGTGCMSVSAIGASAPLEDHPPQLAMEKTAATLPRDSEWEREASQCKSMTILTRGVVAEAGRRALELEVRNSGDRPLISALSVDLFQKDEAVAQFRTALREIAPGRSLRHRIDLSDVPTGRYQALAIVQSRDGDISGSREELEIE